MKRLFFYILLGYFGIVLCYSQSQYFSKTFDLNGFREMTYSTITVADGYILTGGTSSGGNSIELFVAKTNWYGDTIWSKIIRHPVRSYTSGVMNCIVNRLQGGFYVFGTTRDSSGGNVDALLYCFDNYGDTIFTKQVGGSQFNKGISLVESNDGFIYALGESNHSDPQGDVHLIKLDSLGNVLWQKTYGIANVTDYAHTISIDGDHNIYLGTSYVGGWVGSLTNFVPRLIKVDSAGNQKFMRTVNTTDTYLPAGSFGLAHLHTPNQIYLFSRPSNDGYVGKIYASVFDSLGSLIFTKEIVGARVLVAPVDFYSNPDGSLMVCGIGNTVPSYTYNGWDTEDDGGLILKLSPNADSVWARYHIVHPGQYQSLFYAIEPSPFGGYFLAGTYVNGPVQDIWLMSVDANGCLGDDSCGVSQPVSITKDVEVRIGEGALLVYPNPVQDKMYIQIPDIYSPPSQAHSARKKSHHRYDPMHRAHSNLFLEQEIEALTPSTEVESPNSSSTQDCLLNLYAMDGHLIRSQSQAWSQTLELSVSDLPAGIYLLRVMQGENVYAQKVVVGR